MKRKKNKGINTLTLDERLKAWLRHHQEAFRTGLGYLLQAPLISLLMLLAMSVALALPSALYLGINKITGNQNIYSSSTISAFTQVGLDNAQINQLAEKVHQRPDVIAVEIISQEQALKDLSEVNGLKDLLGSLDENPLPATLLIRIKQSDPESDISQLAREIESIDGIAETLVDAEWLQKIKALGKGISNTSLVFGIGLVLLLVLLIHISLRSEILQRSDEIEVVKLVGANSDYIERPFIYFALIYGLIAAVLALVWLALAFAYVQSHINSVAALYGESLQLGVPGTFMLGLIVSVVVLTVTTATLTVRMLTLRIEPR